MVIETVHLGPVTRANFRYVIAVRFVAGGLTDLRETYQEIVPVRSLIIRRVVLRGLVTGQV